MAQSITLQTSDSDIVSSDVLGRLSFAASSESSGSDAVLIGASIYAMAESNFTEISNATSIIFATASSESAIAKLKISSQGHFLPILDKTYDIGASGTKFRNVFAENGKFENISISNLSDPYEILYITDSSGNVSSTDLLKVDVANTEIDLGGDLIPTSNLAYDLGSSSYKFRDTYTDKVILNSGSAIPATTSNTVYNVSGELYYNNNVVALLPSGGVQGQILQKYSTTSNILEWIDNFATEVRVYVKNTTGSALTKGQAVYINGAQGDHPTIALAIADGESSSSKTLGLLKQNLAINEFGYVIAEGGLDGIDTSAASAAGDLIYLSPTTPGGLVYGLANRPTAPNHMVFIGYVVVKQQNNGKVFIKVQNGFELGELHNVATNGTANGTFLQYNTASGLWLASTSGNFTTLQLNGTTVSVTGHTHTSSDITNFNTSVSGLLPTIANSGDNRLLTSTGSSVGINAEANLTFDGSTLGIIGNVGAGTSSPTQRLQVHGSSGDDVYLRISNTDTTTASGLLIGLMGTEDAVIRVEPNKALTFGTNNTERMRITSGGNLEIKSNAGNISTLFTYNENGGELVHYDDAQAAATLLDQCNNQTRLLELINGSDLLLGLGGSNTTGSVRFMRAGFSEIMRINSSGNIGIGSSTNNDNIRTRLQVCGPDADDDPSLGSGTGALLVTNSDSAYGMQFGVSADGVGWIQQGRVDGTATAYNLLLNPVGGSVGIGTSSPSNRFHVQGGELYKTTTDFVFGTTGSLVTTYHGASTGNTYGAIGALSAGGSAWNNLVLQAGGGNVGIGTTSPNTKLQINGQTRVTDGTTNIDFVSSSAVGYIGTQTNHPLVLRTNDTERMRIDGSGNSTFKGRVDITSGTTAGAQTHFYVRPENGALGRDSQITLGCTFSNGWGGADYVARDAGAIRFGANGGSADPRDWSMRFLVADGPVGSDTPRECMRITAAGNIGIGTTSPPELLSVFKDNNAGRTSILIDNLDQRLKMSCYYESGVGQYAEIQSTNNAETGHQALILNRQGGNVGIGTATVSYRLHIVANASATNNITTYLNNTGGTRSRLAFQDTAVTYAPDIGSVGNSITFDTVGVERVRIGNNGRTQFFAATEKYGVQLNNGSTGNGPFIGSAGADIFCISSAGGAERVRVDANGNVLIGQFTTTDPAGSNTNGISLSNDYISVSRSTFECLRLNLKAADGTIVALYQDATLEGSISVAGNTVSYNAFCGSHWSQLIDNSKPEILRGTVLETLDETCEWIDGKSDRLVRVKISDIPKSKRVYGVFLGWDENYASTGDMYVAGLGAYYVRVKGIVQSGDLLESAGDGTAIAQNDDIVRSSTIGKVSSINKITKYSDDSYLVACTLMCG